MIKYLLPLISVLFIGCNSEKKEDYTYFGGKIINPKDKFVFFGDHNGVTDTIALKDDDTFIGKFKDLKEGLYYFKHGPERQYIFLQPNDSLLLRLNTWDFDESIVFSGKNSNRNNALIETFLQNEKDEKVFNQFYGLEYTSFVKKIDSLKTVKELFYQNFITSEEEKSEAFMQILKTATHFPIFRKVETFSMFNIQRKNPEKLPDSIYNYRNRIDLQSDSLFFFPPYNNIIISQIYNDTYRTGFKRNTDDFSTELLNNIDKKISYKKLKNRLLKQSTIGHFYRKSSCSVDKKVFNKFLALSSNEDDKKQVKLLLNDTKSAKKGEKLNDFTIISANGSTNNSSDILKKGNTLLYFRNPEHSSNDWVASRMNYFIRKYPNINFCVVNINNDDKNYIEKLDIKHQYYLSKNSKAHNFLSSKFSRIIIVNKNGVIENGFGGLSSEKIDKQLANL